MKQVCCVRGLVLWAHYVLIVCGVYGIYGGGALVCAWSTSYPVSISQTHSVWREWAMYHVHVTNTSIWVTKSQDCACRRLHVSDWLICYSSTGTPSWMCLTMLHVSVSSILWIHVWQCKYATWRERRDLEGFVLWMTSQVYGEGVVLTERSHCVHAFLVLSNKWYLLCLANIPNSRLWTHNVEGVHKSQLEPPVPLCLVSTLVDVDKTPSLPFVQQSRIRLWGD